MSLFLPWLQQRLQEDRLSHTWEEGWGQPATSKEVCKLESHLDTSGDSEDQTEEGVNGA